MRTTSLHYSDDSDLGITRRRAGRGLVYFSPSGILIRDQKVKARLKKLAIPPAWASVWICCDPSGHIQATGRDARGRKQYIYHAAFRAWREAEKFEEILNFAGALPRLRRRISKDIVRRKLDERLVLAAAVRILDQTLMRIGNDTYLVHNKSYGLTTLKQSHVEHKSTQEVRFTFRGKGGKPVNAKLTDRRVAAILRRLEGLPGQDLFQFLNEQGELCRIGSDNVNAYIRDATGGDFSAKDFRTWAATVLVAEELHNLGNPKSNREARGNLRHALKKVAQRLWQHRRCLPQELCPS